MDSGIQEAIEERKKEIRRIQQEIAALELADHILSKNAKTEKPKSQPDMAANILEQVGKPMHVTQIAAQIKTQFKQTVKSNNLGVMLFRYAKRGTRFYKVEGRPNTYGLIKWQELAERLETIKTATTQVNASD
jgi:hypothetical protein